MANTSYLIYNCYQFSSGHSYSICKLLLFFSLFSMLHHFQNFSKYFLYKIHSIIKRKNYKYVCKCSDSEYKNSHWQFGWMKASSQIGLDITKRWNTVIDAILCFETLTQRENDLEEFPSKIIYYNSILFDFDFWLAIDFMPFIWFLFSPTSMYTQMQWNC